MEYTNEFKKEHVKKLHGGIIGAIIISILQFIFVPALNGFGLLNIDNSSEFYKPKYIAFEIVYIILAIVLYNIINNRKLYIASSLKVIGYDLLSVFRWIAAAIFIVVSAYGLIFVLKSEDFRIVAVSYLLPWLLIFFTYLATTRFFLCAFSICKIVREDGKEVPKDSEQSSLVCASMLLAFIFFFIHLYMYIFDMRIYNGFVNWLSVLKNIIFNSEYIFSSGYVINDVNSKMLIIACENFIHDKTFIVISLLPFGLSFLLPLKAHIIKFFNAIADEFKLVSDLRTKSKDLLFKGLKLVPKAATRGYCLTCQRNNKLYPMVPYSVDTLDVNEEDIVTQAVIEQQEFLRERAALNFENYNISLTILKPNVSIISKTGASVNPNWCCRKCKMTVYKDLIGAITNTNKIVNVKLIGYRDTAKTCFCASVFNSHYDLMISNTPEYEYFKAIVKRLIPENQDDKPQAPIATPQAMIASPVLAIKYNEFIMGITDVSGENFRQATDTVKKDDAVSIMLNLSSSQGRDNISISAANNILAQLPENLNLIILCVTRYDELDYFDKIDSVMNTTVEDNSCVNNKGSKRKSTVKVTKDEMVKMRSKKLVQLFSANCPAFGELYNAAREHAKRVEVIAHAALGTSVDEDLYLVDKYAPRYIDETLDAFCSHNYDYIKSKESIGW